MAFATGRRLSAKQMRVKFHPLFGVGLFEFSLTAHFSAVVWAGKAPVNIRALTINHLTEVRC